MTRESTPPAVVENATRKVGSWSGTAASVRVDDVRPPTEQTLTTAASAVTGRPISIKDNIDVAGLRIANGGAVGGRVATRSAPVWAALAAAGARCAGRTVMPELALRLVTPGVSNPWRAGITAGGSSGGAAAGLAEGRAWAALGTDTGGSIRVPAAVCGVSGLRPTHGALPMAGITPLAPSLDTVGPLAGSPANCLDVFAGMGGRWLPRPDCARIGLVADLFDRCSADVVRAARNSVEHLHRSGQHVEEVELPGLGPVRSAFFLVLHHEFARDWVDAVRATAAAGASARWAVEAGSAVTVDAYEAAQAVLAATRALVLAALDDTGVDILLVPMTRTTGMTADTGTIEIDGHPVPQADALGRFAELSSVTGLPSLAVPSGMSSGLPCAVQLIGRPWAEGALCAAGQHILEGPGQSVLRAGRGLGLGGFGG